MHKKVVVNSTPIIALAGINRLSLLKELYCEVFIPRAVYEEIFVKEGSKAKIDLDLSLDWINILDVSNVEAKKFLNVNLHVGEVEVLLLGKEIAADLLVIDDYNARQYAKYLGVKVTGTIGILLKAKEENKIHSIKQSLDDLINNRTTSNGEFRILCFVNDFRLNLKVMLCSLRLMV